MDRYKQSLGASRPQRSGGGVSGPLQGHDGRTVPASELKGSNSFVFFEKRMAMFVNLRFWWVCTHVVITPNEQQENHT